MSEALHLGVVALTTLVAILVARRRGAGSLKTALTFLLETAGATVLLFTANLLIAFTIVLVARRFWFYASLYDATDIALLLLSLIQGITLTAWSRSR